MLRLATVNATARDFEHIGEVLARLEAVGDDAGRFTQWDRLFHQLLADASHNPLMSSVYRQVNHVRGHDQWSVMTDKVLSAARISAYNRQHRELYEALRIRDGEAVARIVIQHLRDAHRDLLAT